MPFVIDASVTACWLMPDERHPIAEATRLRMVEDVATVPALWWFEVRNLLITNERRGRIDGDQSARALALLAGLPMLIDRAPDEATVLSLARRHRLTVYDAAYLELAIRESAAFATLDERLAAAARAETVSLIGG